MGRERTTGWLAIAVAVSATGWSIWTTLRVPDADVAWAASGVGLLPMAVVAAAGAVLVGRRSLRRPCWP